MRLLKLGGVTWWRNNYGSVLQAYALQEFLNNIDGVEYEIICQYGKKVASVSNLRHKLMSVGVRESLKRAFWKFGLKKLRQRNINIQRFMDKHLKVSEREYLSDNIRQTNDIYDGFVCGSDQIWNFDLVEPDSIYWLTFARKGKLKFSYAPSIGVNDINEKQAATVRANLADFKAVSAREEAGTELLNRVLNEDRCVTVLDPTLLVDRCLWDEMSTRKNFTEPYIFVYMLRGTASQRRMIEQFAKIKGLKIVTMPFLDNARIEFYDFVFGDIKYWDADPADFISVIRNAEYVFTDSFHSTVFSCLYHKNFFNFPKIGKSQLNRLVSLQRMFNIQNRMIIDKTTVDELVSVQEIDWEYVDSVLKERREFSREYIFDALK